MTTRSKVRPVIIAGSGGHAKVLIEILHLLDIRIIGIIDPNREVGDKLHGVMILGGDNLLSQYSTNEVDLVNGIGSVPDKSLLRAQLYKSMQKSGYRFRKVIHPSAIIASDVNISDGVQVMAGSIIQPGVSIGNNTIINTGVCVDHDCSIGSNCHLSPGVTLSGSVGIGDFVHVGTGSNIIEKIRIGSNTVIAAGSIVYRDLESSSHFIQKR